eukprot:TRINITY_DN26357_c0_g1_i1.p1 TRINITY_DN26357_c0_g1~~TRINITY_DN26357_c0_g1_i1.p1  ORF type:complete len:560 (+),score=168.05 TRINITY_DN26357_c0_g1_i1:40-1719(+)
MAEKIVEVSVPEGFKSISEGTATILFSEENEVFYNPVQVFNRDLSINAIKLFSEIRKKENDVKLAKKLINRAETEEGKVQATENFENLKNDTTIDWSEKTKESASEDGVKILEALSATGLRSIRYYNEIPGVKDIIVNDIDKEAVAAITKNIEANGIDTKRVVPNCGDAVMVMHQNRETFDVVDLDPFGAPTIFLDSAIQSITNGGLMCVTCTDMTVLAGNSTDACYAKYGAVPVKNTAYVHEQALRMVLGCLESHANRYKKHIVPLVSVSVDFYVRLFVRVVNSPIETKRTPSRTAHIYQCMGCDCFHLQHLGRTEGHKFGPAIVNVPSKCTECGRNFQIAGPIWTAPIHDAEFVDTLVKRMQKADGELYKAKDRVLAVLCAIDEEEKDVPLFYCLHSICRSVRTTSPKLEKFIAGLINGGYKVSQSHCKAGALKTNAPPTFIYDMLRAHCVDFPVHEKRKEEGSVVAEILKKEMTYEINFTKVDVDAMRKHHGPRYLPNPTKFWGPGTRGRKGAGTVNRIDPTKQRESKKRRNRNKKALAEKEEANVEPEAKMVKKE